MNSMKLAETKTTKNPNSYYNVSGCIMARVYMVRSKSALLIKRGSRSRETIVILILKQLEGEYVE